MKRSLILNSIAYFFILLFLYTGIIKLMGIHQFREELVASPLLGSIAGIIAWALPITEILLVILLFIPALRIKGLYLSAAIMILFTLYVVSILFIDNHLSCSCGGIIEQLSPKQHLLFNTACIILSLLGIAVARREQAGIRFRRAAAMSTFSLFLLVAWTLFAAFTAPVTVRTGLEGRELPSFKLLLMDSTTWLNTGDIPKGKTSVFIGFSPYCTHCQQETRDLISHIEQFKGIQIYLVTNFPFTVVKDYYRYFRLDKFPNITVGRDSDDAFFTYFKANSVPYNAIYDSKKRLKQVINGQFTITGLAKMVAE